MQTLNWLESHIGTLEDGIKELNENHCWKLWVEQDTQGIWYVLSGIPFDCEAIFSAGTREAVDAFLYGMSLAVLGIPDEVSAKLSAEMKRWCDSL
jgi:hypothetical protein